MSEPEWRSLHVAYHAEDTDGLVLDAVRPLFLRLRPQVPTAYHLRHWRRGPHLRLNLFTDPATFDATVRPAVAEIVGGYLAAHPSTASLDPAAFLELHTSLAEAEEDPGPLLPWYPDNSIQEAPYERRLSVLGTPEAADLLAGFYVAATDLAFAMTERLRAGEASRLGLGFDLLLATAHGATPAGITVSFASFRSHAEAFLATRPEGPQLRRAWDEHYARHAETLARRVPAVVAAVEDPSATLPFVRPWLAVLGPVRQRGEQLVAAGRLSLEPSGDSRETDRDGRRLEELSPFHRALEGNEPWQNTIRHSASFTLHRLVLNYAYLHLTRLGVKPVDRFLLCHLIANAVEDAYGISALDVARGRRPG